MVTEVKVPMMHHLAVRESFQGTRSASYREVAHTSSRYKKFVYQVFSNKKCIICITVTLLLVGPALLESVSAISRIGWIS